MSAIIIINPRSGHKQCMHLHFCADFPGFSNDIESSDGIARLQAIE
ncbi:MAG: hypothetical protein ABL921_00025 [Pirellula sp.]